MLSAKVLSLIESWFLKANPLITLIDCKPCWRINCQQEFCDGYYDFSGIFVDLGKNLSLFQPFPLLASYEQKNRSSSTKLKILSRQFKRNDDCIILKLVFYLQETLAYLTHLQNLSWPQKTF